MHTKPGNPPHIGSVDSSVSTAFFVACVCASVLVIVLAIGIALGLASPSIRESISAEAEARYEIIAQNGTATERCVAATEVEQAYLDSLDAQAYEMWKTRRKLDCFEAGV